MHDNVRNRKKRAEEGVWQSSSVRQSSSVVTTMEEREMGQHICSVIINSFCHLTRDRKSHGQINTATTGRNGRSTVTRNCTMLPGMIGCPVISILFIIQCLSSRRSKYFILI